MNQSLQRLRRIAVWSIALILVSSFGYTYFEGYSLIDGLFMSAITFTTVGYGEPVPLTPMGKVLTMPLLALSFISMILLTAYMTSFVVGNDLSGHFLKRKTRRMIANLKNHTIVCGSGSMAQVVIERLIGQGKELVVVDDNEEQIAELREQYPTLLAVDGLGTNELSLAEANLLESKHVVAAMESEVDNLLVSITCKDLGHDVHVYARSNDTTIGNRMRKARVDEVVSPSRLCGDLVAALIVASDASVETTDVQKESQSPLKAVNSAMDTFLSRVLG